MLLPMLGRCCSAVRLGASDAAAAGLLFQTLTKPTTIRAISMTMPISSVSVTILLRGDITIAILCMGARYADAGRFSALVTL